MTNFNLSEKINVCADDCYPEHVLYVKDIKEFIKLLKEEIDDNMYFYAGKQKAIGKNDIKQIIDKLAGDKLQ